MTSVQPDELSALPILAAIVFFSFLFVAVELLLTVARAYLTIGVRVILLSFGTNRFTSNASEGYFSSVFRQGTKILFSTRSWLSV
jgi:hypothetical protein